MAHGAGKYDDACTAARLGTGAQLCALIVVGGNHGNGFSVQTADPHQLAALPSLLRRMADSVEADLRQPPHEEKQP